ncbi:hypothetical protein AUJ38_00535 [bacterium CG1_02_42_9]|nr:MAG: hypothetical protein AUJ38_00535 [bacterium CG1_02_42_9]
MKKLALLLVQTIVSHPEDVSVSEEISEDGLISLRLKVNPEDMGEVIGKSGKIIKAVRSLVKTSALKNGKHITLDLVDNNLT